MASLGHNELKKNIGERLWDQQEIGFFVIGGFVFLQTLTLYVIANFKFM